MSTNKISIMEASKLFKKSRTTIYEAISNGQLNRDQDGKLSLADLTQLYGQPDTPTDEASSEHVQLDESAQVSTAVIDTLKGQIELLQHQLTLAQQREQRLLDHIDTLTLRIEQKTMRSSKLITLEKAVMPMKRLSNLLPKLSKEQTKQTTPMTPQQMPTKTLLNQWFDAHFKWNRDSSK